MDQALGVRNSVSEWMAVQRPGRPQGVYWHFGPSVPEYFDLLSTTIHALEIFKTNCPWCCEPSTGNLGSPLFSLAIKRGMLVGCPVDNQIWPWWGRQWHSSRPVVLFGLWRPNVLLHREWSLGFDWCSTISNREAVGQFPALVLGLVKILCSCYCSHWLRRHQVGTDW